MQTRAIGSLQVSEIGLGCNNFGRRLDYDRSAAVVKATLDAGINFFDTADVYGNGQSEEFLGRALGQNRSKMIIATKFGNQMGDEGGASPAYVKNAAEASLRRLGTDYIDLYQIHKPDSDVPIADTLGALDDLVKAGKVREIGSSNFSLEQIRAGEASVKNGGAHFKSVQNEYSLLKRDAEKDVLPECERTGIAFLPYFPLRSGLLTGKYRQGQPPPEGTRITTNPNSAEILSAHNLAQIESLIEFATTREHTILQLAISWLLRWSSVASVIAGATSPEQVQANVDGAGWQLSAADLDEIDALLAK